VKNLEVLLLALPAVLMYGFTIYMKNIHEGVSDKRSVALGWCYGVAVAGFFSLIYILKFVVI
jgi:hypothetical protein